MGYIMYENVTDRELLFNRRIIADLFDGIMIGWAFFCDKLITNLLLLNVVVV